MGQALHCSRNVLNSDGCLNVGAWGYYYLLLFIYINIYYIIIIVSVLGNTECTPVVAFSSLE